VTVANRWLEDGIRAYGRAQLGEAERCWREALALDPGNERARSYLASLIYAGALAAPTTSAARSAAGPSCAWDEQPGRVPRIDVAGEGGPDVVAYLVDAPRHSSRAEQVADWMQLARDRFALGDFTGSLEVIERILVVEPAHPEALAYLRENESTLVHMYESKIGGLDAIPRLALRPEEVTWLQLDHRAGFLLAQVDGTVSFDDLFALSGLSRLDTARILARFVSEGIVR
jgi:tetratricopeptide (TPR) repeat protein